MIATIDKKMAIVDIDEKDEQRHRDKLEINASFMNRIERKETVHEVA